jgi:hypothetical protein
VKYVDRFREVVAALCEHLGVCYVEKDHQNGKRWEINCGQLSSYLSAFSQPKKIPRELLDGMSREQCRMLMDAIYEGDGDAYHRNNYSIDRGKVYVGVDKEFEDTLQELALRCGYSTSAYGPERNRVVMFSSKEKAKDSPSQTNACDESAVGEVKRGLGLIEGTPDTRAHSDDGSVMTAMVTRNAPCGVG